MSKEYMPRGYCQIVMERAAHDFGGHRVEAIEATNQAIKQLELCLKFDKD